MKKIPQILSALALVTTLLPPVLYFAGWLPLPEAKLWMLVASVVWFATAPLWMERKPGH